VLARRTIERDYPPNLQGPAWDVWKGLSRGPDARRRWPRNERLTDTAIELVAQQDGRKKEIGELKGKVRNLEDTIGELKAENAELRAKSEIPRSRPTHDLISAKLKPPRQISRQRAPTPSIQAATTPRLQDTAKLEAASTHLDDNQLIDERRLAIMWIDKAMAQIKSLVGPRGEDVFLKDTRNEIALALDDGKPLPPDKLVPMRNWVKMDDVRRVSSEFPFQIVALNANHDERNRTKVRKAWESKREPMMLLKEFHMLIEGLKSSTATGNEDESLRSSNQSSLSSQV